MKKVCKKQNKRERIGIKISTTRTQTSLMFNGVFVSTPFLTKHCMASKFLFGLHIFESEIFSIFQTL